MLQTKKSDCTFSKTDILIFYKSFMGGASHLFSIGHEFRRRTANRHLQQTISQNLESYYSSTLTETTVSYTSPAKENITSLLFSD